MGCNWTKAPRKGIQLTSREKRHIREKDETKEDCCPDCGWGDGICFCNIKEEE